MRMLLAFAVATGTMSASCKSTSESASLKHTEGEISAVPLATSQPWRWHKTSAAEADAYVRSQAGPFTELGVTTWLGEGDPRARQAKAIGARIDKTLRERYPAELAMIPQPRIVVADAPRPNGVAPVIPMCFDVSVIFDGAMKANGSADDSRRCGVFQPSGALLPPYITKYFDNDPCPCVAAPTALLPSVVEWMNSTQFDRRKTQCRLRLDATDPAALKLYASGCANQAALLDSGLNHLDKLTYLAMADVIVVTAGVFPVTANEDQLAFIIAHELGHFYRAHANAPADAYDYFYKIPGQQVATKPQPDPSLESFGRLVQKIIPPATAPRTLPGGVLKLQVLDLFASFVALRLKDAGSLPTNPDWEAVTAGWGRMAPVVASAWASTSGSAALGGEAASGFEGHLLSCLGQLHLEADTAVSAFSSARRPLRELLQEYADNVEGPAGGGHFALACAGPLPVSGDLASTALRINTLLGDAACDPSSLAARATSLPLGWYTVEQEADEIALEYMCRDGRPPESGVLAALALFEFRKASPPAGVLPAELALDCRKLRDQHWSSGFVPMGTYQDIHHGNCFRVQDLDRELAAHAYQCVGGTKDKGVDPAWRQAFPAPTEGGQTIEAVPN